MDPWIISVAHADEIKGVVGDNLRKALDWFGMSRQLITIKCDVDLPIKLTELELKPQDIEQLIQLYEQLDMKASLRELRQQMIGIHLKPLILLITKQI
jgi:DNA polymerase-1